MIPSFATLHAIKAAPRRRRRPKPSAVWFALAFVVLEALFIRPRAADVHSGSEGAPLRVAFSSRLFTDVNINDAKASIKGWIAGLAKEHAVAAEPEPVIFQQLPELLQLLQAGRVDAIGMTTPEFRLVHREIPLTNIFIAQAGKRHTETISLLVHAKSPFENLRDLRGRNLILHETAQACLSRLWLETVLATNGLGPAAEFFSEITSQTKLPRTLLPVFFKQADSCLVLQSGFETMAELNPQTGKQLKVLASSTAFVPQVLCFRASYSSQSRQQVLSALRTLHSTPAGQQMLTIFRGDRLVEHPLSVLDSALALIEAHEQLPAAPAPGASPQPSSRAALRSVQSNPQ